MTTTEAAEAEKKDVVPSAYRDKYKSTGGTCGDFIATKLQSVAKDGSLSSIKAENGIEEARWATFNPGMQRMNLANVLRGQYLKGETITILGKQYNVKHQLEDYTGKVEDSHKALRGIADYLELQNNERTITSLQKLLYPAAPKGKTAEERAAEKAAKDAAKEAGKALKVATADQKKAKTAHDKAVAALDKAQTSLNIGNTALAEAGKAQKAATDETKDAANKAVASAADKVGKLEDKVADAETKVDAAKGILDVVDAKVAELTPKTA